MNTVNDGSSDQHMLSGTVQKRFSRGMQLLATYTRSIMKESTSRLNPSDTELERRIANEDRPNRFVLSGVYALPFGAGQPYGSGAAPWLRTVIGGWSVSGIYTYQSGAVLTWGNVIYLGGDLEWDPRNVDACVQHRRRSTPFPRSSSIATSARCRRTSASCGSTLSTR